MTSNDVIDAAIAVEMLVQVHCDETALSLSADGAYDIQRVDEAAIERGAIPIIPPRKNARIWQRRCLYVSQCGCRRMSTLGPENLESMDRLPPAQFAGSQDELCLTTRRACHVQKR